jgi:hypothetical protein
MHILSRIVVKVCINYQVSDTGSGDFVHMNHKLFMIQKHNTNRKHVFFIGLGLIYMYMVLQFSKHLFGKNPWKWT